MKRMPAKPKTFNLQLAEGNRTVDPETFRSPDQAAAHAAAVGGVVYAWIIHTHKDGDWFQQEIPPIAALHSSEPLGHKDGGAYFYWALVVLEAGLPSHIKILPDPPKENTKSNHDVWREYHDQGLCLNGCIFCEQEGKGSAFEF